MQLWFSALQQEIIQILTKIKEFILNNEKKKRVITDTPNDFVPSILEAARNGKLTSIQYLIEHSRVDPTKGNNGGRNPLHFAAENGHIPVVKFIFGYNVNVNGKDKKGFPPLLLASE